MTLLILVEKTLTNITLKNKFGLHETNYNTNNVN